MLASHTQSSVFGKRTQQHILILASGDKIRHMIIKPWMVALIICISTVFIIGYLAATTYLVLRDDLIGATMVRQARMQYEYEDRISALRAQVDRVTSRQLLDQQVVEQKVEKLLERQTALASRHGKVDTLLERAGQMVPPEKTVPVSAHNALKGDRQASLSGGIQAIKTLMSGTAEKQPRMPQASALSFASPAETQAERADRLFSKVTLSLKDIERGQLQRIAALTLGAENTADAIAGIVEGTGIDMAKSGPAGTVRAPQDAIGGPFVEPDGSDIFDVSLSGLDSALKRLDDMRQTAIALPFGNPAPGREITSTFGNRLDPFLGRLALHAGIDFRAETGAEIETSGAGKVLVAGFTGGYGNLVEIDHGGGMTTRYGHMSRIEVNEGDTVKKGDVIGWAGSTGRSTGPHIHYEVRRDGRAINPMQFLAAGMKLRAYMP